VNGRRAARIAEARCQQQQFQQQPVDVGEFVEAVRRSGPARPRPVRAAAVVVVLVVGAASGCASSSAEPAAPSEPSAPVMTAEDRFWSDLTAEVVFSPDSRARMVDTGRWVCEALDVEDVLFDGAVGAWNAWLDGEMPREAVEHFWSTSVAHFCPGRAETFAEVQRVARMLGAVDTDGDGDTGHTGRRVPPSVSVSPSPAR